MITVARKPKMRILKRDELEFTRLKRNYRAKINRIRKKTGFDLNEVDDWLGLELPNIKDLRSGYFKTRADYNEWKKTMKQVTQRSFEPLTIQENVKGMRYPNIVKTKGSEASKKARQTVDEMIDNYAKLPVYIDGEAQGTVDQRELMLPDSQAYGLAKPQEFDIDNYVNPKSVESNIKKNEQRQTGEYYDERLLRMKENFISMFEGTGEELNDLIAERLRRLPPDDFYEMYLSIPDSFSFEDWDSETGSHINGISEAHDLIGHYLDLYEGGKLDLTLKAVG